jgi:hypothetical protein
MNALRKNAKLFLSTTDNSLVGIYNSLVGFELAIKNEMLTKGNWRKIRHDIIPIIEQEIDRTIAIQLKNSLSTLKCITVDGKIGQISVTMYPGLRYFVFIEDDPDGSTDQDLAKLHEIIQNIKKLSKSKGKYL